MYNSGTGLLCNTNATTAPLPPQWIKCIKMAYLMTYQLLCTFVQHFYRAVVAVHAFCRSHCVCVCVFFFLSLSSNSYCFSVSQTHHLKNIHTYATISNLISQILDKNVHQITLANTYVDK